MSTAIKNKLDEWKRQLLDLSKRNRLLHFKESKRQTLRLQAPDSSAVFKRIVGSEQPLIVIGLDTGALDGFAPDGESEDSSSRVRRTAPTPRASEVLFEGSMDRVSGALYTLRSRSHTEMEERGVGVLFLAFGFLHWFEADQSEREICSPIVLVPVDLERKAVLDPYKVVPRDDDIVLNPTLEKVLKDQFNIQLPALPEGDSWDLEEYLDSVRSKILRQKRWRIESDVYLSVFSFLKLNMYRDLEQGADQAAQSPIISALAGDLSRLASGQSNVQEIAANELDDKVDPALSFQVLDADSSQQQAIELVKSGSNLVLQGPPGTGKSQTIANIIAEILGTGRTCLFVSEKAAALDVVHRRLSEVGLADAVLPLHSYKASKRDVLAELARVYMKGPEGSELRSNFSYDRLKQRRSALNAYVRELHRPREPFGISVFQAEALVAGHSDVTDVPFKVDDVAGLTQERIETLTDSMARLSGVHAAISGLGVNPWHGCTLDGQSTEVRREAKEALESVEMHIAELRRAAIAMADALGVPDTDISLDRTVWMAQVAKALTEGPDFKASWLTPGRLGEYQKLASHAAQQQEALLAERRLLEVTFTRSILAYDLDGLASRLSASYGSVFSRLGSQWRQERRVLAPCTVNAKPPKYADLVSLVPVAMNVRQREAWFDGRQEDLKLVFGDWYDGDQTDWGRVSVALQWAEKIASSFSNQPPESFITRVESVLTDRAVVSEVLNRMAAARAAAVADLDDVRTWFSGRTPTDKVLAAYATSILDELERLVSQLRGQVDQLEDWTRLSKALDACRDAGVENALEAVRKAELDPSEYAPSAEKRAFTLWLDYWLKEEPSLKDFDASAQEHLINEFRRFDKDMKTAARTRLIAVTAKRRPYPAASSLNLNSSQPSLLMKEAKKKRRQKPLRRLFAEIPDLLLTIKPCLMMSPLSVSQYLELGGIKFDVVIFDEASQVKPEDAVGAIMRGHQIVVVGDSKQLPPTSFFDVSMGDDFEEDDYYDDETGAFESILDLCGTIGLPEKMLQWHYRSRREGLIAFSNNFLYDNRLVTFPSPGFDGIGTGVDFVYLPDAVYDRSRTRTNPGEVAEIVELIKRHAIEAPDRTIGVVAFSQAQMTAIERALWKARAEDPALEAFVSDSRDEGFFVKNLENVQGDERDVIVFSIGYGKDGSGKPLSMNFGPLNNRGGERRLNVAVTRAREKVVVVSSIRGGEIDLSRTQAEGVRLLKHYLDYAEHGVSALDAVCVTDPDAEFGSPFEEEVARVLEGMGYRVHKQVGCSGYRIDLAIVHPDAPGHYAIGIECDGASYHSAATARERDRLREQVLVGLGWTLHRIWSTDWFRARPREVQRLREAVEAAVARQPTRPRPTRIKLQPPPTSTEEAVAQDNEPPACEPDKLEARLTTAYVAYEPKRRHGDFYESGHAIAKVVVEIAEAEGPIATRRLYHLVAGAWGMDRAGSRIKEAVDRAIQQEATLGGVKVIDGFVWPAKMGVPPVRSNISGEPGRTAEDISIEEVCEAVRLVLQDHLRLDREDLTVATARLFGFEHCGAKVKQRMQLGIERLLRGGFAYEAEGHLALVKKDCA